MELGERQLEYVPRTGKQSKESLKQSTDIILEFIFEQLARKKEINEPYCCATQPTREDPTQAAKDVEQGENNDIHEITRQEDVTRRLNQELTELRGELDRLNTTDGFYAYGKGEKDLGFRLLDCHKMKWKKVVKKFNAFLWNMIIMDDEIYFLEETSLLKLNLETMQTEQLPSMKHMRRMFDYNNNYFLAMNSCLWIFGGMDENNITFKYVEMYNPVTNVWIEKPSLICERYGPACAIVNDKIFVCGGKGLDNTNLITIEVFDLNSETWTFLNTRIPFDPDCLRVAALENTLMFCDKTKQGEAPFWKLNLDTLDWTKLPDTSICDKPISLTGIDNKFVRIGSFKDTHDPRREKVGVEIFDGCQWIRGPSLNYNPAWLSCRVLSPSLIDKLVNTVIN